MFEYNIGQMSEEDLLEAANRIFKAQEEDFEKIKSEKWYQALFHAITLNQDGKKYAVHGIRSLTKLQQLFMDIYVRNYKESHGQLNEVIEVVTKNSEAIKKLYGMCVLNLKEQKSLKTIDAQDAEILALFLGEYRDEHGSVPKKVQDYNRGVLLALNQNVPIGQLSNHQIRRLKEPELVYRCFMEQCAIDGTIDTQEWTDKIYQNLRAFRISDDEMDEIKRSVKYEAEIAGVDYFIQKYANAGVLDSDFLVVDDVERPVDPVEAKIGEARKKLDPEELNSILSQLKQYFPYASSPFFSLEILSEHEINEDINNGQIRLPCLTDSIKRSLSDKNKIVYAYKAIKIEKIEELFKKDTHTYWQYFLIATMDGFFFFADGKIAFVEYESIKSVEWQDSSVSVCAWRVRWYSENGSDEAGSDTIVITKNVENEEYLGPICRVIMKIIKASGGCIESSDKKVQEIVAKYIKRIPSSSSAVPYLVKDLKDDYKGERKLKNALNRYARKVRKDEVIGFIDTTLFGNGKDGVLFSKDGIAFDYNFKGVFVKYAEIDRMWIQEKTALTPEILTLRGTFSELEQNYSVDILCSFFNTSVLKECLEEIMYTFESSS